MTHYQKMLHAEITRRITAWHAKHPYPEMGEGLGRYCLWWAYFTCQVLNEKGIRAQLQVGSCFWPREWDAEGCMRFGYQYEPGPHNFQRITDDGTLPEIHCWVAIAETETIIDATTGYWPVVALAMGHDWPGEKPPQFFWSQEEGLPKGVTYVADREAISIAYSLLAGWIIRNKKARRV